MPQAGDLLSKARDSRTKPVALTVAALDPSGGAGIAADLRTFAAEGVWGCAVMTAITYQNTVEVTGWEAVGAHSVTAQLETLLGDVYVDAVKLGMAGTSETCHAIANVLEGMGQRRPKLVIDPVLRSSNGASLGSDDLAEALAASLIPLALLVTPNLDEASVLVGSEIAGVADMAEASRAICEMGAEAVLVTGGHGEGDVVSDVLCHCGEIVVFESERIASPDNHGTGCVLSAAIAASLAKGNSLNESVLAGRSRVASAIARGFALGAGAGPVEPLES